jgi:hypothetical protein
MRWVLSIFRIRRGPVPVQELPSFFAKLAVLGAVTGPFWAAFFMMFGYPEGALQVFVNPVALFWASVTGVVFALCFGTICGLGNGLLRRVLHGYPPAIAGTIYIVYNAVGCSLACALSFAIVMHLPGTGVKADVPFLWAIVATDGSIGAVLALIIGAFIKLKCQVEDTQKKLSEMAMAASQAQARALQSQINPHFFFNTLNTISALVEEDPAAARETIGRLSDLFRYTLGCACAEAVTLGEEVQFVRDYLSIERARFRKRLRVELPEGELPDVRIPGLVLQPLVENAIKHGIAPLIEGGSVRVRVEGPMEGRGERFRVSVRNTADEHALPNGSAMFRPGHALDNVRARLRIFTGEEEPLRVHRGTDWVEFSFEAPAV